MLKYVIGQWRVAWETLEFPDSNENRSYKSYKSYKSYRSVSLTGRLIRRICLPDNWRTGRIRDCGKRNWGNVKKVPDRLRVFFR